MREKIFVTNKIIIYIICLLLQMNAKMSRRKHSPNGSTPNLSRYLCTQCKATLSSLVKLRKQVYGCLAILEIKSYSVSFRSMELLLKVVHKHSSA